jgi:hypothetical protein
MASGFANFVAICAQKFCAKKKAILFAMWNAAPEKRPDAGDLSPDWNPYRGGAVGGPLSSAGYSRICFWVTTGAIPADVSGNVPA